MLHFKAFGFIALCLLALIGANSPALSQQLRWEGTAPFCNGSCRAGGTEVTRASTSPGSPPAYYGPEFGSACATGSKALCRYASAHTCRWDGTAPFCKGSCRRGEVRSQAPAGSSSGRSCVTGHKVYCCT